MGDQVGEGPRARQRRALEDAIEEEALRLLVEGGPTAVTMRAIARSVGKGVASLYSYVDGIDDVVTTLLVSGYRHLAEATGAGVAAFADAPPMDRALAGILAHRHWALGHRHEFNLLFVDQVPGYRAPVGGPTVAAQLAAFEPILGAMAEVRGGVRGEVRDDGVDEAGIILWTAFHGAVSLEVNHHLDWLADPGATHEAAVRAALGAAGLAAPSPGVRRRFERWAARSADRVDAHR